MATVEPTSNTTHLSSCGWPTSVDARPLSPAEFGKLIAQDTEKWSKAIRAADIKADLGHLPPMFHRFSLSETALCPSWGMAEPIA